MQHRLDGGHRELIRRALVVRTTMTTVLMVVVIGAVLLAFAVDLGAFVGWLRRRWR